MVDWQRSWTLIRSAQQRGESQPARSALRESPAGCGENSSRGGCLCSGTGPRKVVGYLSLKIFLKLAGQGLEQRDLTL